MEITVLGKEIPKASETTVQALINRGILFRGEDGELHVTENKVLPPTKVTEP